MSLEKLGQKLHLLDSFACLANHGCIHSDIRDGSRINSSENVRVLALHFVAGKMV